MFILLCVLVCFVSYCLVFDLKYVNPLAQVAPVDKCGTNCQRLDPLQWSKRSRLLWSLVPATTQADS